MLDDVLIEHLEDNVEINNSTMPPSRHIPLLTPSKKFGAYLQGLNRSGTVRIDFTLYISPWEKV